MDAGIRKVYLRPGELYVAREPAIISTVLGSCVSVTIHSGQSGVSGMCHAIMPTKGVSFEEPAFHYVDCAVDYMMKVFNGLGADNSEMVIKLFGGSDMLGRNERHQRNIGAQNVEMAKRVLYARGFSLRMSDTGGKLGRKIIFNTMTNEVFLKRIGA